MPYYQRGEHEVLGEVVICGMIQQAIISQDKMQEAGITFTYPGGEKGRGIMTDKFGNKLDLVKEASGEVMPLPVRAIKTIPEASKSL